VAGLKIPQNFLYYLSMHAECNERLLARARELQPEDVEISTEPQAVRIKKMVNAVLGESHRMKAFVRLAPLGAAVLYGFMRPRHKIGEHICDHFARRNDGMIIVLGNGRESWVSLCRAGRIWRDHGSGIAITLEKLKAALHCDLDGSIDDSVGTDSPKVEDLWQVYYDSQYCPERNNHAAFKRHMPRRDQEAAGLRLAQNRRNLTLDDFLGD
jgi:probable DNA metabolism protein